MIGTTNSEGGQKFLVSKNPLARRSGVRATLLTTFFPIRGYPTQVLVSTLYQSNDKTVPEHERLSDAQGLNDHVVIRSLNWRTDYV